MLSKAELRRQLSADRRAVANKVEKDEIILSKQLRFLEEWRSAKTVLCYVSLPEEIDTDDIIEYAWKCGKTVAVPYCKDKNGYMDFYILERFSDLHFGMFNVREPDINKCRKLADFSDSVCIVPGIAFDKQGNRLGYGKGYYDRFLKKYPFISIGLCYNSLIKHQLPTDEYDESVDIIVTETQIINVSNGGKNG